MIEVKSLETIPPECAEYTGGRIRFSANGLRLTAPNALEDKLIRWCMEDRGLSLKDSYAYANASSIYPDTALVPCITEVFKTKWFDPMSGEWKRTGGQFTCIGFQKCFVEYLTAGREYPGGKRMEIAPGIFAPSPKEELCIKQDYYKNKDIRAAYIRCVAGDIIPGWSGALAFISNALDTEPMGSLYEIIKLSYRLATVYPVTPPVSPPVSPPPTPKPEKETGAWVWIGLGFLGLLMLSEGEGKKKASLGQLEPVQKELFKVPRGRLVLKRQDISTSDDPVMQCLERQGWKVKRVQELQEDIAAKMTPDIFTQKTEPLTGGEKMLQEAIDRCLERMKASRSRRPGQQLSGNIMSCESWYEDPYTGWHCFIYAPSCRGQTKCRTTGDTSDLKTCVETKLVEPKSDRYKVKWITRCARYAPACSTIQCLEKPAPMPRPPEPSEKEIRSVARSLSARATEEAKEFGPALAREILSRGGISPYKGRHIMEEYMGTVPLFLRRKKGLPLDEMASEMGMDERELLRLLSAEYGKKVKRRFSWRDFYDEAKDILMREYRTTRA